MNGTKLTQSREAAKEQNRINTTDSPQRRRERKGSAERQAKNLAKPLRNLCGTLRLCGEKVQAVLSSNQSLISLRLCVLAWILFSASSVSVQAQGWQKIFDGKTLTGWQAPDMSYFTVEDGAITGTTTAAHNPPYNQFIVWQGGEVADFELKFKFRIFGAKSNSGMQFRSAVKDKGLVHGYQADMDGAGKYLGGIWDEYGTRRSLAGRGEKVLIDESGKKTVTRFAESEALLKNLKTDQWNDYQIIAAGSRITLRINGQVTAELDDRETGKAARTGVLAMPIIPGEPMKVQYKDIYLKRTGGQR